MTKPDTIISDLRAAITKEVLATVRTAIDKALASLEGKPAPQKKAAPAPKPVAKKVRKRKKGPVLVWVADSKKAKRVPHFVTKMTGLAKKDEVVAKYGEGATFEVGKPAPPEKVA